MSSQILSEKEVTQIIKRISYQIIENNLNEDIVLVGVEPGGLLLAQRLLCILNEITENDVSLLPISLSKENPLKNEVIFSPEKLNLDDKVVILCDDVLNSGKTLAFCLKEILNYSVKKIQTAVLVLRTHSLFPIYANFKGYELSTTINETVVVTDNDGVYLK